MKITKLDQSGLIFTKNERNLVIDPVEIDTKLPFTSNIDVIVFTHGHSDHFQPELLNQLMLSNPQAKIFVTNDMVEQIKFDAQIIKTNEEIKIGEFNFRFFGGQHAPIVDNISPCQNFGVIIDGVFVNPGDSFDNPNLADKPEVLFVAISAPWLKVAEAMKYITDIKPKKVVPVHNALLSPLGSKITNNWIQKACDEIGAEYITLDSGESFDSSNN